MTFLDPQAIWQSLECWLCRATNLAALTRRRRLRDWVERAKSPGERDPGVRNGDSILTGPTAIYVGAAFAPASSVVIMASEII